MIAMTERAEYALIALRRIQRQTENASRRLARTAALTPSQLKVLQTLDERGDITAGELSDATQLKHATITSLVDKLVDRGFVSRRKCSTDRRRVWLVLEALGATALRAAPDLLQDKFQSRFGQLPDWQQAMLVASLEHVAMLLDADELEAAPVLDVGPLDERPVLEDHEATPPESTIAQLESHECPPVA